MSVLRRLLLRRGTAAQWTATNPTLKAGEPGWDATNRVLKVGDGTTPWSGLSGISGGSGTPGVSDHGALSGLTDDDHPQYLTQSRADGRYASLTALQEAFAVRVADGEDETLDGDAPVGTVATYTTLADTTVLVDSVSLLTMPGGTTWTFVRERDGWRGYSAGGSAEDTTAPTGTLTAATDGNVLSLTASFTDAVGVSQYRFSTDGGTTYGTWQNSASSTSAISAPGTARVQARDAAGNVGEASAAYTYEPPADTVPPTASMTASATAQGVLLTVSNALDLDAGLPANPYRFSTDGGTTWSAWQSSATYDSGDLGAGTYQPRAQVRDAAATPNVLTLSADPVTVVAGYVDPSNTLIAEGFNGTGMLHGTAPDVGAGTWVGIAAYAGIVRDGNGHLTMNGGRVVIQHGAGGGRFLGRAVLTPAVGANAVVNFRATSEGDDFYALTLNSAGQIIPREPSGVTASYVNNGDIYAAWGRIPGYTAGTPITVDWRQDGASVEVWGNGVLVSQFTINNTAAAVNNQWAMLSGDAPFDDLLIKN